MRNGPRAFWLVLSMSVFFVQAQQGLSSAGSSDADSSISSDRIAVAAVGDSATSEISKVAGRAPYYLVFDGNGVLLKSIKNPARNREGGASSRVVDFLKKESAKTVIAGRFGAKMQSRLEANKVEYHERTGTAKETVEAFVKNKRCEQAQD